MVASRIALTPAVAGRRVSTYGTARPRLRNIGRGTTRAAHGLHARLLAPSIAFATRIAAADAARLHDARLLAPSIAFATAGARRR
jgi:hypothetical protein